MGEEALGYPDDIILHQVTPQAQATEDDYVAKHPFAGNTHLRPDSTQTDVRCMCQRLLAMDITSQEAHHEASERDVGGCAAETKMVSVINPKIVLAAH